MPAGHRHQPFPSNHSKPVQASAEARRRVVADTRSVALKLAADRSDDQRRILGGRPVFTPCPWCGQPVEQGRSVRYRYCSTACAVGAAHAACFGAATRDGSSSSEP